MNNNLNGNNPNNNFNQNNNYNNPQNMNNNLNGNNLNNNFNPNNNYNNNLNENNQNNNYNPNNNYNNIPQNINQPQKKGMNKKTIIIIIVAVLAALFVPIIILTIIAMGPVNKTLDNARNGTFIDEGLSAITAVKNDYIINSYQENKCYTLSTINTLVEKQLNTTAFGTNYSNTSYIKVEKGIQPEPSYYICLVDEEGKGIAYTNEDTLSSDSIEENVTCTPPPECN